MPKANWLRKLHSSVLGLTRRPVVSRARPEGKEKSGEGRLFRAPSDLATTPTELSRVLVLGGCLAAWFAAGARSIGCTGDFTLINNRVELPDEPPNPIDS